MNLELWYVSHYLQKVTDEYMKKIDSMQKQKEKVYWTALYSHVD